MNQLNQSRRGFLSQSAGLATVASFGHMFAEHRAHGAPANAFGPLIKDPQKILDLPKGFKYSVIEKSGDVMSDGLPVLGAPDGMGCFAGPKGTLILMRNHELDVWNDKQKKAFTKVSGKAYSKKFAGGVSRIVLDGKTKARLSSNQVLLGTLRNCAGGVSPWGWLTCEEAFHEKEHGYVFLTETHANQLATPQPIKAYGRFIHEAAIVDPSSMVAYLTEDRDDSSFYRFVPDSKKDPFKGKLQALRIKGKKTFDTGKNMQQGDKLAVDWVTVKDPDPAENNVRQQAQSLGAAIFYRGEGLWLNGREALFTATSGGPAKAGQVFGYTPDLKNPDAGTLHLISQSPGRDVLDMPDNITVSPSGQIYVAEDGSGTQHIRHIGRDGKVTDVARNAMSSSEMAGLCFSPDGQTMFGNIQGDGITFAITGPFAKSIG